MDTVYSMDTTVPTAKENWEDTTRTQQPEPISKVDPPKENLDSLGKHKMIVIN
jgi:hypothetical protein